MPGDHLGRRRLIARSETRGNGAVDLAEFAAQEAVRGGVAHESVLEGVRGVGRRTALEQQLAADEAVQGPLKIGVFDAGDRGERAIAEVAPDAGRHLGNTLDLGDAVQARHQAVMQGGGDVQLGIRAVAIARPVWTD